MSPRRTTPRRRHRLLSIAAWAATMLAASPAAAATTYYVSPHGSDRSSGRSPRRAWRTVRHVDAARLRPGDRVLFAGGGTFGDNALMPGWGQTASGRSGAPIVFGSYGRGLARLPQGIWIDGESHLVFTGLEIGPSAGIEGTGYGITVEHCHFHDFLGAVEVPLQPHGSSWAILDNTIDRTGDSGMVLRGSRYRVQGNRVTRTGLDGGLGYGTHGIYVKAPHSSVIDNTIIGFRNDGISVRYGDSVVRGNIISGGEFGIAWFQYASWRGTSTWSSNVINATSIAAIYVSPSDQGGPTNENFVIDANLIARPSSQARRNGWAALALSHDRGWYRVRRNRYLTAGEARAIRRLATPQAR